jgi:hypothetical protein
MIRGCRLPAVALLFLMGLPATSPAAVASPATGASTGHTGFIPNVGQFRPAARFQFTGSDGTAWLTDRSLWLTYLEPGSRHRGVNLEITFRGLGRGASLVPTDPQATRVNYLLGDDPDRWHANVPTYGGVRWIGTGGTVEFAEVHGALALTGQTDGLRLRVKGAEAVRRAGDGSLVATTAIGEISLLSATVGQASSGAPPDLLYGTFLGAHRDDRAVDVAVEPDGSVAVIGQTVSPLFPTTPGVFDRTYGIGQFSQDVFVSRFSPDGSTLAFSTFLGGSETDYAAALVLGPDGSHYATGHTCASDFPTTDNAFDRSAVDSCDGFVTKLDPTGSSLVFSTLLGGGTFDGISGLVLGPDGVVHVAGETLSANFPTTAGAYDRTINFDGRHRYADAFVAALSADGSALLHSTYLGGRYNDRAEGIALDGEGSEVVTGEAQSPDLPTTAGAFDRRYNGGGSDAFVIALTPGGDALRYSTYLGGSYFEDGSDIALGPNGSAYVVGKTSSPDFPATPGAFDTSINSFIFDDVFVAKLNPTGSKLRFATFIGGDNTDFPLDMVLGADGTVSVTGTTFSKNFPTRPGAFDRTMGGPADALLVRVAADGASLGYASFLGGDASVVDDGFGLAAAGGDVMYVVGATFSTNFPTTPGAYDTSYNGRFDAFVVGLRI